MIINRRAALQARASIEKYERAADPWADEQVDEPVRTSLLN